MADTNTSAAAVRMREHRERRRNGLRCLTLEIHDNDIDGLIRLGLLEPGMRNDHAEIMRALYEFLDVSLGMAA